MSRQIIVLGVLAVGLCLTGCHSCCTQRDCTSGRPSCYGCQGSPQPPVLKPALPAWRQPANPPIANIGGPQQATYLEPRGNSQTPKPLPNGGETAPNPPVPEEQFPETGPAAKLLPPRRIGGGRQSDDFDDPRAEVPGPRRRADEDKGAMNDATAGLLNVKEAIDGVYSGFTPFKADQYRWLSDRGVRTILHLREPGADNTEIKRAAGKNSIAYEKLDVSVTGLTIGVYETFVKQVNDTGSQPLYVCDKDGQFAGALWYLYFLYEKNYSDTDARVQAKKFGLDFDDKSKSNTTLIEAVQVLSALLKERK